MTIRPEKSARLSRRPESHRNRPLGQPGAGARRTAAGARRTVGECCPQPKRGKNNCGMAGRGRGMAGRGRGTALGPDERDNIRVQLDVLRDRLAEQRAILDTLVEANAEDGPALQETAQLLADTEVALQEAREEYKRRTQATPASAPATAPDGPPEATQTDRRDRDRDPSCDRSRSPTAPSRLDTS